MLTVVPFTIAMIRIRVNDGHMSGWRKHGLGTEAYDTTLNVTNTAISIEWGGPQISDPERHIVCVLSHTSNLKLLGLKVEKQQLLLLVRSVWWVRGKSELDLI